MPEIEIALVSPLYEGNVGFAARVMKNFGFTRLVLIDPCEIGDEAFMRAAHASDVLENAERLSFEEVCARSSIVIATTGEVSKSVCNPMRMPYFSPNEIRELIADIDGRISILFGRENWGLNNEEIQKSDIVCTIPSSKEYPILNLSHAVGIVCYELAHIRRGEYLLATREEMEYLYAHIDSYLTQIDHPDFKRVPTMLLIRRVLGRAMLTSREATTLHGLMRRSEWKINPAAFERIKGNSSGDDDQSSG
ncbi:MAG: putative RNA methyltransferase [Euryarchaeota archaeon ADurb.BinA087]|nr:MAG: putative RNA methyltransferase [Euryarchaeota archaeon ADurb.BinA087]HNQ29131.1 RNA methyltransferase [Methanolinea sp.]